MQKGVTNKVLSDKVVRERTYEIVSLRGDRKDVMAQLAITINQLLDEGFTGCIEINCGQGRAHNVKARENKHIL